MDKRWYELAEIIVNYSVSVKKGEKVMIAMYETHTEDFVNAIVEKVIQNGAYPQIQFCSERIRHLLLKYGESDLLNRTPDMEEWGMHWADVYIALRGAYNLGETYDISPEKFSVNQKVNGKISSLRWKHTRWCLVKIPSIDMANQAKVALEDLLDDFFSACFDSPEHKDEWNLLIDKLNRYSDVRILAPNTDLNFSIKGRKWLCLSGEKNIPDGEVLTAPIVESVNGYIRFPNPGVLGGQLFHDLYLEWSSGKLIKATSSNNQELLEKILATDDGASLIGEFAIGLNKGLTFFSNDILFDEKIFGTVHIALGRAYPECGGTNSSSIHWDIILDLRSNESELLLDGKTILKNSVLTV